jgi:hypothetical protein
VVPTVRFVTYSDNRDSARGGSSTRADGQGALKVDFDVTLRASSDFEYRIEVVEGTGRGNDTMYLTGRSNQLKEFTARLEGN